MIYPKDFSCIDVNIELNTLFILMPFDKSFDIVHASINRVCLDNDILCKRADDLFDNQPIIKNILNGITKSEIIIADLTGRNPNVYYEVGISHSLRDQDSIILLTQDIKDIPFDLRHLPILIYDLRNLAELKSTLELKIAHCQSAIRKRVSINRLLISNNVSKSLIKSFLDRAEQFSKNNIQTIFYIINGRTDNIERSEVQDLSHFFVQMEEHQGGKFKIPCQILKLKIYLSNYILEEHQDLAKSLLIHSKNSLIHLDNSETFSFIADYCFGLINKNKLKEEAINWIVQYLHNYRMGRIDLVRAKIDAFLLEVKDEDVDNAIIKMLSGETVTVRETAADLCGQKSIKNSTLELIKTLENEKNPHVARSCITALTKLEAKNAITSIYNWMKSNEDKWGDKAVSASLKDIALRALEDLDDKRDLYLSFREFINLNQ